MKVSRICQVLLSLTCAHVAFSYQAIAGQKQQPNFKLAFIKQKRSHIQVRKEPRADAEIIGQIAQDVFIHCVPDMMSDWWLISQGGIGYPTDTSMVYVYVPPFQGKGYINRKEIQLLDDFTYLDKHKFLLEILTNYLAINEKHNLNQAQHGGIAEVSLRNRRDEYHELKYIPILPYVEELVCTYNDLPLLHKFIEVMVSNANDADERPPSTLGRIYDNNRKLMKKLILEQPMEGREALIDALCFYFISSDSRPYLADLYKAHYKYHTQKLQSMLQTPSQPTK